MMKTADLNNAMQYIDDRYLDLADAPQKEIMQMTKRKNMTRVFLIAAVVAMLALTAYAADFLNIRSVRTFTEKGYTAYRQVDKAMKQAGFQMDIRENFDSGFTFEQIHVQANYATDENGKEVAVYKDLAVHYRNEAGTWLALCAEPARKGMPESPHTVLSSRQIDGIEVKYFQDHYRFVPEDYELTEEDKLWMEQPGNELSYGSDEVEEETMAFLRWEKNGIIYLFLDMGARVDADVLFAMAEELIQN